MDELRNVRLKEASPGVFRLDHDRNRHDDRAVALALAASYLVERPATRPGRTYSAVAGRRGLTRGWERRVPASERFAPPADGRGGGYSWARDFR